MKNFIKKCSLLKVVVVSIAATSFDAIAGPGDNVRIFKIPNPYVIGGKTFHNLDGYVVNIVDWHTASFKIPQLHSKPVRCDMIDANLVDSSGQSYRTRCFNNNESFTCSDIYSNSIYAPQGNGGELLPMQPVSYWVAQEKSANPTKEYIGINLSFFETDKFSNRPTDWKPIYEESCAAVLGSFKANGDPTLYSDWQDVEITNGVDDKYFGNVVMHSSSGLFAFRSYADSYQDSGQGLAHIADAMFNGVYIRNVGIDNGKNNWKIPEFVRENWDKAVARTSVAFDTSAGHMRIVVIQGGRDGSGVTVEDLKLLNPSQTYDKILLLDGSGSSQLASTVEAEIDTTINYTPSRTDCFWPNVIKECSQRGDRVDEQYVDHWPSSYLKMDPNYSSAVLIERPVPSFMLIEVD